MGRTITKRHHLCPLEWRNWCTTSQIGGEPLQIIETKATSLVHILNINAHGKFGWSTQEQQESPQQFLTRTSTSPTQALNQKTASWSQQASWRPRAKSTSPPTSEKRIYNSWSNWVPLSIRDRNIKKTNHRTLQLHWKTDQQSASRTTTKKLEPYYRYQA